MFYQEAHKYLKLGLNRDNYLFLHNDIYMHRLYYEYTIFSSYTGIKIINFSAKALKETETKRTQEFKDYSSEFFLIAFLIIGVWIIQPRLNKIVKNKKHNH